MVPGRAHLLIMNHDCSAPQGRCRFYAYYAKTGNWRQKTSSRNLKTKLSSSQGQTPGSVYCLLRVWQLGSMEIETSPQTLFIVCFAFLLFNGWDRESVCVKVLMLVFGCLYLSDLRNRAAAVCERCQDECTHTSYFCGQYTVSWI